MTDVAEAQRIDTELALAWREVEKVQQRLDWHHSTIQSFYQRVNGTRSTYVRKTRKVLATDGQILTDAVACAWLGGKAATDPDGYDVCFGYQNTYGKVLAKLEELTAAVQEKLDIVSALEEQYTGWSRFFVVTSSAGHIHRSTHCATCRWSTTYGWLPHLSGLTEDDAVAECGPALCSVCFPSAPLDHLGKLTAAQARKLAGV